MTELSLPRIALLDGGMGEELVFRGVNLPWYEPLLAAPEVVRAVHADYIAAGADVITTNSYGVTRRNLAGAGMGERAAELNRLAGRLAREAREEVGRDVLIAGSLPPQSGTYRPSQVAPAAKLEPLYREQAEALYDYIDLFLCETMSTAAEARAAAEAACATGKPVWVSWTLGEGGRLRSGETVSEAAAALEGLPVSGLLVNCATPESVTAAVPQLVATGRPRGGAYANTLLPIDETTEVGWHMEIRRDLDIERYAEHAARWLAAGANVVGGCCGTRPAHIARLRLLIDQISRATGMGTAAHDGRTSS